MDRHLCAADGDQCQHAADGQVNAAGDDHQRHAAGEDAVNGRLPQRVAVGADLEKRVVGIENDADDQHQQQRDKRAAGGAGDEPLQCIWHL